MGQDYLDMQYILVTEMVTAAKVCPRSLDSFYLVTYNIKWANITSLYSYLVTEMENIVTQHITAVTFCLGSLFQFYIVSTYFI